MAAAPTHEGWDEFRLERTYDDMAGSYRWVSRVNDTLFGVSRLRRWVMSHASGVVLDVACGTGENFPLLTGMDRVTAVDLSAGMLEQARARAAEVGIDVDLRRMSAQALDFADDSFDTVASAMSTCTFPDPSRALEEMARVVRRDGVILLVEHGRSTVGPVAGLQDRLADRHLRQSGCRWTQDPQRLVRDAGLVVDAERTRTLGVMVGMVVRPA